MNKIILLLFFLKVVSFFQLSSMQKDQEESEHVLWNDLITLTKGLKEKFSENKKILKAEVIQELQTRIATAYYAAHGDNLPLNDLHRYLVNTRTYLQDNLDDPTHKIT